MDTIRQSIQDTEEMLVRRVFGVVDGVYEQLVHHSDTETAVTAANGENPPATPLVVEFAPREYGASSLRWLSCPLPSRRSPPPSPTSTRQPTN